MIIEVTKKALKAAWIDHHQPLKLEFGSTLETPFQGPYPEHHVFHWQFEGEPDDQTVITLRAEQDHMIKPCTIRGQRSNTWGSKLVITKSIESGRKKRGGAQSIDYKSKSS